jgi:hypothetical protein
VKNFGVPRNSRQSIMIDPGSKIVEIRRFCCWTSPKEIALAAFGSPRHAPEAWAFGTDT